MKLKLRPDVQMAKHGSDVVILVGEFSPFPLRLSGVSSRLIDLLEAGCSRQELCEHLQKLGYPAREVETAIGAFLNRLMSARILQSEAEAFPGPAAKPSRWTIIDILKGRRMIHIDPLASLLAQPFRPLPSWLIVSLGCLVFATSLAFIVMAAMKGRLSPAPADFSLWSLWGILGIVPCLFFHELAHAVACRAVGCRVSGLGIHFAKLWKFSIFVDTRYLVLFKSRWAKAWVALAGPFMDVVLLGLSALVLLRFSADEKVAVLARVFFFMMAVALILNLIPWRINDGSNAVGALVDDQNLVLNALSFKRGRKHGRVYFYYRVWVFVYIFLLLLAIGYAGWLFYPGLKAALPQH